MIKKKIKNFKEYFIFLDNPIDCLLFKFGLKKKCTIKLKKNKETITLNNTESMDFVMNILPRIDENKLNQFRDFLNQIENDEKYININGVIFLNSISKTYVDETTYIQEYFCKDFLTIDNLKNRIIIDIGANVADSALYYANEGAQKIISFEPVKEVYELGIKNINLNPKLSSKIHLLNKGVSYKKGWIKIDQMNSTNDYIKENDSYDVEIVSIKDILNDFEISPDLLKIDCEGCEFEIIENEDLSGFNDIIFEHHSKIANKDYKNLVKILKQQGFKIKLLEVTDVFDEIGIIHAYK